MQDAEMEDLGMGSWEPPVKQQGELDRMVILAPGPVNRNRRTVVSKFAHEKQAPRLEPEQMQPAGPFGRKKKEENNTVSKLKATTEAKDPYLVPHLLESRAPGDAASGVQRGVVEGGVSDSKGASEYFVLLKVGGVFRAFPADMYLTFRPHIDRSKAVEAAAAARAAAAAAAALRGPSGAFGGLGMRMVPKSMREEMAAKEAKAQELAAARASGLLKDSGDEDLELKRVEGGGADSDGGLSDDEGGGGGGKGRKALTMSDGEALHEDEVQEDVYRGEQDELRPERPEEAEDWEHEEEPADDDQDQGAEDNFDDDPGMRKKLGIEDEEEELSEGTRKLLKAMDSDASSSEDEEEVQGQENKDKDKDKPSAEDSDSDVSDLDSEAEPEPALAPTALLSAMPSPAVERAGQKRREPPGTSTSPGTQGSTPPQQQVHKRARTSATPPPSAVRNALPGPAAGGSGYTPSAAVAAGAATSPTLPGQPGALAASSAAPRAGAGAVAGRRTPPPAAVQPAAAVVEGFAAPAPALPEVEGLEAGIVEQAINMLRASEDYTMPIKQFTAKFKQHSHLKAQLKALALKIGTSSQHPEKGTCLVLRERYR